MPAGERDTGNTATGEDDTMVELMVGITTTLGCVARAPRLPPTKYSASGALGWQPGGRRRRKWREMSHDLSAIATRTGDWHDCNAGVSRTRTGAVSPQQAAAIAERDISRPCRCLTVDASPIATT
jgi:hypothetical protein